MKCFAHYISPVLLVALAVPALADDRFQFRDGDRIVFLGDSITQYGEYPLYFECALLERFPDWKLIFRNVAWNSDRAWLHQRTQGTELDGDRMLKLSGQEQEDLRRRIVEHGLVRDVLPLRPTVAIIMFGANDVRDGDQALRLHIDSLRQIITHLRKIDCRVILLSASPEEPGSEWNTRHEQFLAAVHRLATQEKATFVDVFHPVLLAVEQAKRADSSFGYTRDGVHPHPAGHAMIAHAILQGLGIQPSVPMYPTSALLAKVTAKNKEYFHRWRGAIPAVVAGKLDMLEIRAQLTAADERIADLEAEIDITRRTRQ